MRVADKFEAGEPLTDLELNELVCEVGQAVVRDCARDLENDDPKTRERALKKLTQVRKSRNEVARSVKLFRNGWAPKDAVESRTGAKTPDFIVLPGRREAGG